MGKDGTIGHAEARIGDSVVLAFDSRPHWPATPSYLRLYTHDADAVFNAALAAGATTVSVLDNSAWGDRGARIEDPLGNVWSIMSHMEDVSDDEAASRWQAPGSRGGMDYAVESLHRHMTGQPAATVPGEMASMARLPRADGVSRLFPPGIDPSNRGSLHAARQPPRLRHGCFRRPEGVAAGSHGGRFDRSCGGEDRRFEHSRLRFPPRTGRPVRLSSGFTSTTAMPPLLLRSPRAPPRSQSMTEMFWGERVGRVRDPLGNLWWIHCRVAELTARGRGLRQARRSRGS